MNLEELVPPLELCKKIPAGEFEQSALVIFKWENVKEPCIYERLSVAQTHIDNGRKKGYCFPAPTLQEILEELHKLQEDVFLKWSETAYNEWLVNAYTHPKEDYQAHDKKLATAALKVWLKMKGIE